MRNHISFSSPREAPEAILRALRVLDPAYDIHYLGFGRWAVGRVVRNTERMEIGERIRVRMFPKKQDTDREYLRYRMACLASEGFGVVNIYSFRGEPTTELVNDIRMREHLYRTEREKQFSRALGESEGEIKQDPQTGELKDRDARNDDLVEDARTRYKEVAPVLLRDRKSFHVHRK